MSEMGKYSKAYLAKRFREYPGWKANVQILRKDKKTENNEEVEIEQTELRDDDILYLQENYVVTHGILKDEKIIFDQVDEDWKTFCKQVLKFEIPKFEPIEIEPSEPEKQPSGA